MEGAQENAPPLKKRRTGVNTTQPVTHSDAPRVTDSSDAAQDEIPSDQRRSLFVRSIASETTSEALAAHFSESYPIKHAVVVTDKETKKGKGYGFVTFTDAEDTQRAQEEFDGSELEGRRIKVEIAKPRQREDDETPVDAKSYGKFQQGDKQPPPRLIIRNLPWSIKEPDQLAHLFRSYGKVKVATIPKKGGKLIGFGVVVIRGRKNAEKAIGGLNGKEIDGRTIAVDWAVDKETWEKAKAEQPDAEESPEMLKQAQTDQDEVTDEQREAESDQSGEDFGAVDEISGSGDSDYDSDEMDESQQEEDEQQRSTTIFIRNLPFTCTDEDLYDHFRQFGPLRYARVVLEPSTERSRGTGFVCFGALADSEKCLREAPKFPKPTASNIAKDKVTSVGTVLQDDAVDPSGRYTLDGRILSLAQAVSKQDASRLTEAGHQLRSARDRDKRRLYLLNEGTISTKSPLYKQLSPSEIAMREASAKQRKMLIQSNPSLHISLTRLSIRNIPRSVDSKALKALARDAIVGFATDVKGGSRLPLSKEELSRSSEDMKRSEHDRKAKGQGVVKQAKVVFETREGSKVKEAEGAGRSRGYGFIEYHTHRSALMGLRWLNGYAVGNDTRKPGSRAPMNDPQDRKKRLIVEFAIENAQVVNRRKEREAKLQSHDETARASRTDRKARNGASASGQKGTGKRKRTDSHSANHADRVEQSVNKPIKDDKLAKRNRIIAKKRAKRRAKSTGAGS